MKPEVNKLDSLTNKGSLRAARQKTREFDQYSSITTQYIFLSVKTLFHSPYNSLVKGKQTWTKENFDPMHNKFSFLSDRLTCNSLIFLFMFNWLGHSIPFSTSCIAFHLPFCSMFFFSFVFFSLACVSGLVKVPNQSRDDSILLLNLSGAGTNAISEPEALVISSLHRQYKNMRNFRYLLLLVFFFNIKSLHHFIIFLRNWNSGFNSGSQGYTFSHETLQFRKKNSVKNYIHSSLVLDQKLSGA